MTQPANKRVVTEAAQATAIGVETSRATAAEATKVPKWQPSTAYTAGDVVMTPDGSIVKRLTSGTSGSSYTSGNWQSVATVSGTQANTELNSAFVRLGIHAVSIKDPSYNAVGDGIVDDTIAINNTLTAAGSGSGVAVLPRGVYKTTAPVIVPAGVEMHLAPGAVISHTVYDENAVVLNAGSVILGGQITSPSTWDGTNTGGAWTYAVISVEGDGASVQRVTLNNVPKVGIGLKNVNEVRVISNRVIGNYPSGQWTGVETNHFGIAVEPGISADGGNIVIANNNVKGCVQGIWCGPLDGSGIGAGLAITGNSLLQCWNHGVYAYGNGITVTGNSFQRCQYPVALSGGYHTCASNTIYTATTTGTDERDIGGISIRDAIGCVVEGNTIRARGATGGVGIDVRALTGTVVRDNIVSNNTVDIPTGTAIGIRIGTGATTCENNSVVDNNIRTIGVANLGAITVSPTGTGIGTRVALNTIVMLGNGHGIYLNNQDGAIASNNQIRLEFDSGSAITLGMVALAGSSTNCKIDNNEFRVSASWGTNITLRAIYELAGTTTCRYSRNQFVLDTTKLTAAVTHFLQSGGALLDETLAASPAGSLAAAVGSLVKVTSGGAASVLFVKESGTGTSGWISYGRPDVQTFTASGTWTKPPGAVNVSVVCIGGGGPGGSGARVPSGTIGCGGGGGGAGGWAQLTFPASLIGATVSVTVGAGGIGGASVSTDGTPGNAGTQGTATSFGSLLRGNPGGVGGAGTVAGSGGTAGGAGLGMFTGASGGSGVSTGLAGSNASSGVITGGGGGGGVTATPAASTGGSGGSSVPSNLSGASGGAINTNGNAGSSVTAGLGLPGSGGGGGGSSITGTGGDGGNGGNYGSGAGGGGATLNGNASGKGGDGGAGICIVTSW